MRMHGRSLSMILLFGIVLLLPVAALSEEEPSESVAAIVPGPEDKEAVAVMEILAFMDLVQLLCAFFGLNHSAQAVDPSHRYYLGCLWETTLVIIPDGFIIRQVFSIGFKPLQIVIDGNIMVAVGVGQG